MTTQCGEKHAAPPERLKYAVRCGSCGAERQGDYVRLDAIPEIAESPALEAVLLFHSGGPWDAAKRARWLEITGNTEATTKILCDTVRGALFPPGAAGRAEGEPTPWSAPQAGAPAAGGETA